MVIVMVIDFYIPHIHVLLYCLTVVYNNILWVERALLNTGTKWN